MFIRAFRLKEDQEVLINIDHISMIEVGYVAPDEKNEHFSTSVQEGLDNPAAKRWYKVHVAGEVFQFLADPDDPVVRVIEEIYKSAVKG
jgi:hypothetical protein